MFRVGIENAEQVLLLHPNNTIVTYLTKQQKLSQLQSIFCFKQPIIRPDYVWQIGESRRYLSLFLLPYPFHPLLFHIYI